MPSLRINPRLPCNNATPIPLEPATDAATPVARRQRLGFTGCATSTTRASSSPSTSAEVERRRSCSAPQSARRSLASKLEDFEVFDMSACDWTADVHNEGFRLGCIEKMCKSNHAAIGIIEDMCQQAVSSSPRALHCTPMKSPRIMTCGAVAAATGDSAPDAWSVDDWSSAEHFSPVSSGCHTSPSSAAENREGQDRAVSDVVLAELRVDMEAAMQRAVNQMSSWISEEICFARKDFEKELHEVAKQASEVQSMQCLDVQSSQVELRSKVEELQGRVEESLLAMGRMAQMPTHKISDEARTLEPRTSTHVVEAKMVAEERRWRMKLDGIENTLSKHFESIDMLGQQLTMFSTKFAGYDVDIHSNKQAMQKIDSQLQGAGEKGRSDVRARFESQLEMIDSIRKQCSDIEARVQGRDLDSAFHSMEARLDAACAEQCGFKTELDKRLDSCDALGKQVCCLAEQVISHTETIKNGSEAVEKLEQKLEQLELGLELGEQASKLATNLAEEVALHTNSIQNHAHLLERMELKMSAAETSQLDAQNLSVEHIKALNGAITAQISASEQIHTRVLADEQRVTSSLDELRQELHTQLKSKVDFARFSSTLATVDEVTRHLMETAAGTEEQMQSHTKSLASLAEALSSKANDAEVNVFRTELKAWVENACETHKLTIFEMSALFEQVRTSSEAQNEILKNHEQWIMDLSASL